MPYPTKRSKSYTRLASLSGGGLDPNNHEKWLRRTELPPARRKKRQNTCENSTGGNLVGCRFAIPIPLHLKDSQAQHTPTHPTTYGHSHADDITRRSSWQDYLSASSSLYSPILRRASTPYPQVCTKSALRATPSRPEEVEISTEKLNPDIKTEVSVAPTAPVSPVLRPFVETAPTQPQCIGNDSGNSACSEMLAAEPNVAPKLDVTTPVSHSFDKQRVSINDFEILKVVGFGMFGKVHLCKHKATGKPYCLKSMKKSVIVKHNQVQHTQNEKELLLSLDHPGIVKVHATFSDEQHLFLLMQYVPGGELFSVIRRMGKLPEHIAKFYAAEIILTLEFLHEQCIVYRDLKPENILLDETGHIKLTDFGFAKRLGEDNRTWTMCGTPDYMAPEIISMQGHGTAVDYWALGVLVFEMLVGFPPFADAVAMNQFAKIREPEKLIIPDFLSPEAVSFIRRLLVVDPARRLGAMHKDLEDIKLHPWFAGINFVELSMRKTMGPIVPRLCSPFDTSYYELVPMYYSFDDYDSDLDELLTPEIQEIFDNF